MLRGGRSNRFVCILPLLLACVLCSSAGWTQDNREAARAAFDRGVAALEAGQFADAATAFEESYRLRESPAVLNNLAVAYRGMGRIRASIQAMERFLANPSARSTPASLAEMRVEVERLRRSLASVQLRGLPENAVVRVDGETTPINDGRLVFDPGRHSLEFEAPGVVTERRQLTLAAGSQTELPVRMASTVAPPELQRGRIIVEPSVEGARVFLDGTSAGRDRIDESVIVGEHRVVIRAPGHNTSERVVRVTAGGVFRVDAVLSRNNALPGWVLPVSIGGSALVVGGVVLGVVLATGATHDIAAGSWGRVVVR